MADVRMAQRDASFYPHPSPKAGVYHVVKVDGVAFVAACDNNIPLVSEDVAVSATSPGMRCQRARCWTQWRDHG